MGVISPGRIEIALLEQLAAVGVGHCPNPTTRALSSPEVRPIQDFPPARWSFLAEANRRVDARSAARGHRTTPAAANGLWFSFLAERFDDFRHVG